MQKIVIVKPVKDPPCPKSVLPWSEEAELVWQHLVNKYDTNYPGPRSNANAANYYSNIYKSTFEIGLSNITDSIKNDQELSGSISETDSGLFQSFTPVKSTCSDHSFIIQDDSSKDSGKETLLKGRNTTLNHPHFDHHLYKNTSNFNRMMQNNVANCEVEKQINRNESAVGDIFEDSNDANFSLGSFTQLPYPDMSQVKELKCLLSPSENYMKVTTDTEEFIDTASHMSSPPLDLSPDNETYHLLSQKYKVSKKLNVKTDPTLVVKTKRTPDTEKFGNKSNIGSNVSERFTFATSICKRLNELSEFNSTANSSIDLNCVPEKTPVLLQKSRSSQKSFNVPVKKPRLEENESSDAHNSLKPLQKKIFELKNVYDMNQEEKESLCQSIKVSDEVAVTLMYEDGSSQLREKTNQLKKQKSDYKPISLVIAYSKHQPSFKNNDQLQFASFPLLKDKTSQNYHFSRSIISNLFSSKTRKLCFEAQETITVLLQHFDFYYNEVCLRWNVLDPKIAGWLLNPDNPPVTFRHILMPYSDLEQSDEGDVCDDLILLGPSMLHAYERLRKQELWHIYLHLEMPLVPILSVMEIRTIVVDAKEMLEISSLLKNKLVSLEQKSYEVAGQPFNLNSHQQLRVILFEKLKLDVHLSNNKSSKTSHGSRSTSESVLTKLADFHPLPKLVLEHRQNQKLKSTYIDGMLVFVKDNELCTHWDHIAAATGRLTSTNPNIQSIPKQPIEILDSRQNCIIGKETVVTKIYPRAPFKSHDGFTLLAADFKQIELRILAHLANDESLLKIFNDKDAQDIFTELTSKWLRKDIGSISNEERENTKRVVYSVMYGVGKERLSEYLKTSPNEAKTVMQSFLLSFPGINIFTKQCIAEAQRQKYQCTIFKRRRYFPNITHANYQFRAQAERQAVNFCVQGSAADICKVAMIQVEHKLCSTTTLHGRLLFQIHDELLIEVPDSELLQTAELVKTIMESTEGLCGNIVKLKVPLQISLFSGKSWGGLSELII